MPGRVVVAIINVQVVRRVGLVTLLAILLLAFGERSHPEIRGPHVRVLVVPILSRRAAS